MITRISKKFRFDAGHRLIKHPGLCHNLHGHSYKGVVTVEGNVNKETGMVMDFKALKTTLNPLVEVMDHAFIANDQDKDVIKLCLKKEWKLVELKNEPTAENIAEYILSF